MAMTAVTITQITYEELELLIEKSLNRILNDNQSKLMNIQEAANYLSLAKQTMYGLVMNKKIPFHKKGKRLYFIESELTEWISKK
jgi:excisionase family DNA binding protein